MRVIPPEDIRKQRTIRYSDKEYDNITQKAKALNLKTATFIRARTLADDIEEVKRYALTPIEERKDIALILSALGASRMASNLNQIAYAINTGTLVLSPDVIKQITDACETLKWMRGALTQALGLRKQ
ncbi:plasmid mobilization protein [Aliiglaciecola aliphaticivorans]